MKAENKYWFYSYVWESVSGGLVFVNEVSKVHPLKTVLIWHEEYDGNNNSVLLNYHEITKEQYKNLAECVDVHE